MREPVRFEGLDREPVRKPPPQGANSQTTSLEQFLRIRWDELVTERLPLSDLAQEHPVKNLFNCIAVLINVRAKAVKAAAETFTELKAPLVGLANDVKVAFRESNLPGLMDRLDKLEKQYDKDMTPIAEEIMNAWAETIETINNETKKKTDVTVQ